jgi:hypothetical protein
MYRRPILCTLYGAVDFLKVLKIAVVGGGGGVLLDGLEEVYEEKCIHYVPVEEVLGRNVCNVEEYTYMGRVSVFSIRWLVTD